MVYVQAHPFIFTLLSYNTYKKRELMKANFAQDYPNSKKRYEKMGCSTPSLRDSK